MELQWMIDHLIIKLVSWIMVLTKVILENNEDAMVKEIIPLLRNFKSDIIFFSYGL